MGFSKLTHDDETATYRALRRYQSTQHHIVNHYGGRIVDTAGDSTLAIFPVAADSIRAAVAIQDYLKSENTGVVEERQIQARIGINRRELLPAGGIVMGDNSDGQVDQDVVRLGPWHLAAVHSMRLVFYYHNVVVPAPSVLHEACCER